MFQVYHGENTLHFGCSDGHVPTNQITLSKRCDNVTFSFLQGKNIIQLMTYDEVNTRIDQPMEHDIHRGTEVSEVNIMFHGLINPCIHRN